MGVVTTNKEKCQTCYSCIRNCPTKAIKVEEGQAKIVEERCISCGYCVRVCAQQAKKIDNRDLEAVRVFLRTQATIAIIAPSFPASFPDMDIDILTKYLMELGFTGVQEVILGIQMTVPHYREHLKTTDKPVIASYCPAVVGMVEKHYPRLIPYLAPIDSAVMATAKYVRRKHKYARVVFIGPCVAKKEEARNDEQGIISAVLTFKELKLLFDEEEIKLPVQEHKRKGGELFLPQTFPVSGGLLKNLGPDLEITPELSVIEGKDDCLAALQSIDEGLIAPPFLDILFCKGCIDGPEIASDLDNLSRKAVVLEYARKAGKNLPKNLPAIDLSRRYQDRSVPLPYPSQYEIKEILKHTFKTSPEDELNCGACGYDSCREKAVAVFQGLAEIDMCLPYLLSKSRGEIEYYRDRLNMSTARKFVLDSIIGESPIIISLKSIIEKAAKGNATVLIQGESGVGKEVVAQAIHNLSSRSGSPFIGINCAALPELLLESELFGYEEGAFTGARKGGKPGKFELANGGTILLDEIGDLPLAMQGKLLRVLQEREFERVGGTKTVKFDVRVLAATNRDLRKLAAEGKFRIDLFYRLNVLPVYVPPLRERKQDIPLLIGFFIEKFTREKVISPKVFSEECLEALLQYTWPGNVRELENIIERSLFLAEGSVIRQNVLPPHIRELCRKGSGEIVSMKEAVKKVERQLILDALNMARNNKQLAAKLLGITRVTLYQKIKEYGINLR
jgi:DNA-binding NtrC family response regulator/iron only hydrogenase large subunit-like protein